MRYQEKIYIEKNGQKVFGEKLPVITCNRGEYYFIYMTIFQDGTIDCGGYKDLEQISVEIEEGKLLNSLPENVELECELGMISSSSFEPDKKNEDLIKEIEDIINELNNRDTRRTICENAYKTYLIDPSDANFTVLRQSFDDLPSHQKVLFEYIETKDPLFKLMNGTEEHNLENRKSILSHYFNYQL